MNERPGARRVGLQPEDLSRVMEQFGVSEEQVRRDHAISLVLAALSQNHRQELLFFGGTALSRTYLDEGRLSEDIDLMTDGDRDEVTARLVGTVERAVQRSRGYEPWPTAEHEIEQRYADVAPAILRTPTLPAFAGWKTSTWVERSSPRDLYDLWALGRVGALDAMAAALFAKHGTTGGPPRSWMFTKAPAETDWQAQLAGQTRLTLAAREALAQVHAHWQSTLGEQW